MKSICEPVMSQEGGGGLASSALSIDSVQAGGLSKRLKAMRILLAQVSVSNPFAYRWVGRLSGSVEIP